LNPQIARARRSPSTLAGHESTIAWRFVVDRSRSRARKRAHDHSRISSADG
jgi:hypothetical protein